MEIVNYESIMKQVFNIMLIEVLLIWIYAFIQKRKYKKFSVAINYLLLFLGGLVFLFILEWLCIHYIFTKQFIFKAERNIILKRLEIESMVFVDSLHYLLKFIFLGLFFTNIFISRNVHLFFKFSIYALVIFEFVMVFKFKSYQSYDSLSSTIKNTFIIIGSGLLLYKFYKKDNSTLQLQKNPYFWIILGLFLPAITEVFLEFIFSKLYATDLIGFYKLYLYRNGSQIIGYLLLIKGFSLSKFFRYLPEKY